MQTFLPYASFEASAQCLDRQRLGKQRVECWQLFAALTGVSTGWRNHPAAKMWQGYESALLDYGIAVCEEWISRGYKDTMLERFRNARKSYPSSTPVPQWFGDKQFHVSHQSNLIRKDPGHYAQLFPGIPDNLPYIWPSP